MKTMSHSYSVRLLPHLKLLIIVCEKIDPFACLMAPFTSCLDLHTCFVAPFAIRLDMYSCFMAHFEICLALYFIYLNFQHTHHNLRLIVCYRSWRCTRVAVESVHQLAETCSRHNKKSLQD